MAPLGPPDPPASSDRLPLVLAEELVLLCTDPDSGTPRVSRNGFQRAIAAAVLTELLLTGGITVEDRRITGFRPVGAGDEVTAEVLARLERAPKGRRPGLDAALRRAPRGPTVRSFREQPVAQALRRVVGADNASGG
ncbi:GPP34 family phosphoprotein [Kitasatospora purpeofusca]|uniref:GPP34 family phosphoprotein n=1 Tax=Kitasatospora purpeofusca TaxID=67352 RepID=UPI0038683CF4|nr:GPP34 family phosphoprotein [Kitasatospora purpeofusca]